MVVLVEGIEIRNTVAARRDAPRTPSSLALFLRFPSITLLSILAASLCFPSALVLLPPPRLASPSLHSIARRGIGLLRDEAA